MFNLFNRKKSNTGDTNQEKHAESNIVDQLGQAIDETTDQLVTKADQVAQHIDNTAQQVKTEIDNKLEEYTKLGKRLKHFKLPFAMTETNFIQKLKKMESAEDDKLLKEKLTQEIQAFKALYYDYDADIEALFGKLKFRGIIENEYDVDASEDIDKIDNSNKILRRLDIILALNNDAWWDKLFKHNQDVTDKNHLLLKKIAIKQMINKDGIYLALSTESLYQLHVHYRTIIDAMKEEQSTVEECKKELGYTGGARWELHLKDIIRETTEELAKINKVIIDRLTDSSTNRHSLIEDDRVQWICRDLLPYLPASEKLFHQFANKRPRLGMYQTKFQYFVKHFSSEDFQAFANVMPVDVLQHVKTSGFWEKLPNWLTSGRRQRANFIANHLYALKDTKISANNMMNTQFIILRLDDIANVNRLDSILDAEKSYDRLIQQVGNERPRGLWASLFKQETQQMFDKYIVFLKNERNKIKLYKENFVKQLNDLSSQTVNIRIEDTSATGKLRHLLKEAGLEQDASTFFSKTDFLKSLLNDIVSLGTGNMIPNHHAWLPKVEDIKDLISTIKNFTQNKEQIEALDFVQDLILQPRDHLQADVEYLQLRLKPLSDLADSTHSAQSSLAITFFDKLVTKWIQSRCLSVHSIEFQFLEKNYPEQAKQWILSMAPRAAKLTEKLTLDLKRWPQLSSDEKKLIYNSFDTMLDFSWHQSVNYYQEYVNIIKKNLQHLPDDELDTYAELIDSAKNSKLKLLYQVKQLKVKKASIDEVMEFILQIRQNDNIKIKLPLDKDHSEFLYSIVMPYQPAWQAQQELLIRQFAHHRLPDYYTERLIAGITAEKEENIHSDLDYAYPAEVLTLIYGSKNYQRLLNVFDQCLEKNCTAKQLKIMANFLPSGIEKCINDNPIDNSVIAEQIEHIKRKIKDKIEFNKIKALFNDASLSTEDLIKEATKLIEMIKIACPNYPSTSEGRVEFQQLIGQYEPLKAKQQSLFYYAFGNSAEKRTFFSAWIEDQLNSQPDKVIDVLPEHCSAEDILSRYQQDDAFYLKIYQSIAALLDLVELPKQLIPLIKNHLPIGMAQKFENEKLKELVTTLQASIDEFVFLSDLASLHHRNPMASIEDINQFIANIPVYPDQMKTPFIANKYKAVVTQSVLPYDSNWKEQQKLLLTAIAPEHLPTYYSQWLKGLIKDEHQDVNINPIRSTDSIEMLFFHYGKFENNEERQTDGKQQLINVILPLISEELKNVSVIDQATKEILMRHVPHDLESHYQAEQDKTMIAALRILINNIPTYEEIDNQRNAELSRLRTRHITPNNMVTQETQLTELQELIKEIDRSNIPFPKSKRGERVFNTIIKFEETQQQIVLDEKWLDQQALLIKHYAPQHLPALYTQWLSAVLEGKMDAPVNLLSDKTTCQDIERIYGPDNLSRILAEIENTLDKDQIDYKLVSFLLAHLPEDIEQYHPSANIEAMRGKLSATIFNELEQMINNQASLEEVERFIQSTNVDVLARSSDRQQSILSSLFTHQSGWAIQQHLLISSFPSAQSILPLLYQSWFSGLLKGEHHDLYFNPLKKDQDILACYGYRDNASGFIGRFLPELTSCIKRQVSVDILSLISEHLEPFKDNEIIKPFIQEIKAKSMRIERFMREVTDVALDLVNAIESYENISHMHRHFPDHPESIFARFALEKLRQRAIAEMKAALERGDHIMIEKIHEIAVKSEYFSAKEDILDLYRDQDKYHIKRAYSAFITQLSNETANETKFKTLTSLFCIDPSHFQWLDLLPKAQLTEINTSLLDLESKLNDKDYPLKKYFQAVRERLDKGKSFESEDDWKLITEHANFMLVIDFTKAMKKKKMSSFDMTDPQQKSGFDEAINNVLQSPYQPSKMFSFWRMLLSPYLKKRKIPIKKSTIENNLKYIEKLIAEVDIERVKRKKIGKKNKCSKSSDVSSNQGNKIKNKIKQKKKQVSQKVKQTAITGLHKLIHHSKPVNASIMEAPVNEAAEITSNQINQITNAPTKLPVNEVSLEMEAAKEIRAYIALREKKSKVPSFSIFKKDSKKVKISGATKMVNLLENKPIDAFTKDEINALKESRLGIIIDKYKNLTVINDSIYTEKQTKKCNH